MYNHTDKQAIRGPHLAFIIRHTVSIPRLGAVLTRLLAPGPGVDEGLGLFWVVKILLVLLSLLLVQLLTMETTAAIVWSTVSVTASAAQDFHSTVVLPCLP